MTNMMKSPVSEGFFGYFAVASVSPRVSVANPKKNLEFILDAVNDKQLPQLGAVVLPELCITGYTCGDLFFQNCLIKNAEDALCSLVKSLTYDLRVFAVGVPLIHKGRLYNCAVIFSHGEILGVVPKSHIPNYQEFYEKRWFTSGRDIINDSISIGGNLFPFGINLLFFYGNVGIGIEICEDLWVPDPPSSRLSMAGAELILNLSATDDTIGKFSYIRSLVSSQSGRCRCAYAYASAGRGESSTDLVFSGINLIGCDGNIIAESERFESSPTHAIAFMDMEKLRNDRRKYSTFYDAISDQENFIRINCPSLPSVSEIENFPFFVDPFPFIPSDRVHRDENCREIVNIQSWGLARRLEATGCRNLVIGISGGLDSTLALLVAHFTFNKLGLDTKGIIGVTMPADATSERTRSNAIRLMRLLDVSFMEIPVGETVARHFSDIGHDPDVYDAVYENSQARERTQILMDLANKFNGMVLGTGDMSELALGWCTYNGDHMSMYNVNAGVPKTLVRYLVKWFAENTSDQRLKDVLFDIVDTPISPELIPSVDDGQIGQKTEELVGPYDLHDFFLFHTIRNGYTPRKVYYLATIAFDGRFENNVIRKWLINFYRRFFSQQFKRSCMPDGPKIGSVCLSPRGDWRMPSDASAAAWINEAESIPEL